LQVFHRRFRYYRRLTIAGVIFGLDENPGQGFISGVKDNATAIIYRKIVNITANFCKVLKWPSGMLGGPG
jgi:hypothetical protein